MDSKNLTDSEDSNVGCNTKNIVKRDSFIYSIDNFSTFDSVSRSCGQDIPFSDNSCGDKELCQKYCVQKYIVGNGHTFNFELDSKVKGFFDIYPYGNDDDSKDYVSLSLHFKEFSCLMITALCKFSILNTNGKEEYKSIVGVRNFDANKTSYCLQKFLNRNDLRNRKNNLLPGDRLTVCFEIFYLCDDEYISGVSEATHIGGPLNMLLNDISRMLDSSGYYDCIIKVKNHEIKVHKCILDARSEVFRSMLKYKLADPQSSTIEMNDYSLEVVKEMVNYIYTGKSPRIDKLAIEMLEVAEKYKLVGLKMIATESLLNSLNVQNVCEYLEVSETYSAEILKEFCIRYIYLNADEVIESKNWSKIVNLYSYLVARILNVAVSKC
uniref:Speckle-type POZ protein (inferred by orthology to a human protein) n=1 Tax=Strongyloides papillosus TaxID=174720 RepID=A0A0N5BC93_STREA